MLQIRCDVVDTYSLAMEQSGVPLLKELVLGNTGDEPLENLTLELGLYPDLGEPQRIELPPLRGGEELDCSDIPFFMPVGTGQLPDQS